MNMVRVLLMTAIFLIAADVSAEAGISVTPDRHVVELSPGESRTVEYQIYNTGPQDLDIEVEPQEWSGLDEVVDVNSWVSLEGAKLSIKVNETKKLKAKVTAPEGAEGEMLAMLFLCYKEDVNSILNIRNGIPLYLVIKDTAKYAASVEKIEFDYTKTKRMDNLAILVNVKNQGNVRMEPDIEVIVRNSGGDELKKILLKEKKIVLRGKDQLYKLNWRKPFFQDGNYTATATLNYEDKISDVKKRVGFEIKEGKLAMLKEKEVKR
ncbi:MAG: hypothetical protein ABH843_08210 [Candidatus Omnitrophota bacterium]